MKKLKQIFIPIMIMVATLSSVFFAPVAWADTGSGAKTSILTSCGSQASDGEGGGIFCILNIAIQVLTYGIGILGTLGIVISGIMYLTARDNEQQVTKAKSRIINIVIGLAIYAVMWGFLQWLLPGGILHS